MRPLSNLPPGVTDAMIDAHFGGDISEGPEEWDDEDEVVYILGDLEDWDRDDWDLEQDCE